MRRSQSLAAARRGPFPIASQPVPQPRFVTAERTTSWLGRGWQDFVAHPRVGLAYGVFFAFVGWLLSYGLVQMDMGSLILPLASGFLLVGPLAAIGLYEVSRRHERGLDTTLMDALLAVRRNGAQIADMGLVLLLFFFAWVQLSMILFALFYGGKPPGLETFTHDVILSGTGFPFLATGTLVGGSLAVLAFALSVVSMPMLLDRDVTTLTAMRASLMAVALNWKNMIGWAATLASLTFLGLGFFFVGLAITLPVAAHASWHAYRDLVER
jgi:uncharacterized membrane protein